MAAGKERCVTVVAPILVVDPLPLYRRGVAAVLAAAGHPVETHADPLAWVRQPGDVVVLLTLLVEHDWDVLRRLCALAGAHVVIAVLDGGTTAGVRALRLGARSVVPRAATGEVLRRAVVGTIEGQAVMPAAVAAELVAGDRSDTVRPVSTEEVAWLRQLAAGVTVGRLASAAGYSERAMFRLLRGVYRRMGVRTRIEAIMLARESDWF
ncbi:response regulator transcription factor [Actinokineospora enzanensis]|uniref:response regulator transcription factor n=1 Tax=Actinokineospora enzanensis TaxID=155975 RepID=UPI0003738ADB|nr:response regulator transcription factor [Actinokineospora enzanensis]